jgi:rhodanese-related sulfurtransferase
VYVFYKYTARRRLIRELRIARISVEELKQKLDNGEKPIIVDLRDTDDFESEPNVIPGAQHIDASEFGANRDLLPNGKDVILYCT